MLDSQTQYEDYKKCYTHNGTWSAAGCSVDTGSFPAIDDAAFDVGRFDDADSTSLVAFSQRFSANLTRRFILGESGTGLSMSVVYSLTFVGFLVMLVWLLQHTLLRRSKQSADIERNSSVQHTLSEKDKVIEKSTGVKGVD